MYIYIYIKFNIVYKGFNITQRGKKIRVVETSG